MEGIILAAGYGSRLRSHFNIPKYYVDIRGYPLLYYPYYSLSKAGISKVYIIFNDETYRMFKEVEDLFNMADVEALVNPYPELDNGYTLVYGLSQVDRYPIIVSVSDHIYPYHVASEFVKLATTVGEEDFIVAGDASPDYVDIDEATKIRVVDGWISSIGKGLQDYSYIDMGLFLFYPGFKEYVDPGLMEPYTINDFLNRVVSMGGRGRVYPVEGLPWKDVDTFDDYVLVTQHLYDRVFKPYFNPE